MNVSNLAIVVKWQTRQLEGLVLEREWRFESSLSHWYGVSPTPDASNVGLDGKNHDSSSQGCAYERTREVP